MNCYTTTEPGTTVRDDFLDLKPTEPLGPGLPTVFCSPFQMISNDELWLTLMLAEMKSNIVFFTSDFMETARVSLDDNGFKLDEKVAQFVADLLQLRAEHHPLPDGNKDDLASQATIFMNYLKTEKKGSLSHEAVTDLLTLITNIRARSINHLAVRAGSVTDTNYLKALAAMFNIKAVSATKFRIGQPIRGILTELKTPWDKLGIEFPKKRVWGKPGKEIINVYSTSKGKSEWILHARSEAALAEFIRSAFNFAAPKSYKFGEDVRLLGMWSADYKIGGETGEPYFPKWPGYIVNLDVIKNDTYREPAIQPAPSPEKKKRLGQRIRARFKKFADRFRD